MKLAFNKNLEEEASELGSSPSAKDIVSYKLIIDTITEQIEISIKSVSNIDNSNHIRVIEEKFNYFKMKYEITENSEELTSLKETEEEFYNFLYSLFNENLFLSISNWDTLKLNSKKFIINSFYSMFIIEKKSLLKEIILNYVLLNKVSLVERYKNKLDKKDISFANIRKILKNYNDTILVYFSDQIINDMVDTFSVFDSFKEILLMVERDLNLESFINNNLDEQTSEFIDSLLAVLKEDESFLIDVHNDILEMFPKNII